MSFFDPCISVLVGGWRNGESVLFRFLCKLIAGLIDFSWPRPSPSPWRSLPDGGSHAEGAEYSGSEWEAGQEVGARWGRGAGGTAGPQLAPTRHDVTRPQTLWSRSHLSYSLLGPPGLGACVLQILFHACGPISVCIITAKTGLWSPCRAGWR